MFTLLLGGKAEIWMNPSILIPEYLKPLSILTKQKPNLRYSLVENIQNEGLAPNGKMLEMALKD